MGETGRIVFGPRTTGEEAKELNRLFTDKWRTVNQPLDSYLCNCVGPQPGEKKCPCALRAESQKGRSMVEHGVVIDGVHYDLVPRKAGEQS